MESGPGRAGPKGHPGRAGPGRGQTSPGPGRAGNSGPDSNTALDPLVIYLDVPNQTASALRFFLLNGIPINEGKISEEIHWMERKSYVFLWVKKA